MICISEIAWNRGGREDIFLSILQIAHKKIKILPDHFLKQGHSLSHHLFYFLLFLLTAHSKITWMEELILPDTHQQLQTQLGLRSKFLPPQNTISWAFLTHNLTALQETCVLSGEAFLAKNRFQVYCILLHWQLFLNEGKCKQTGILGSLGLADLCLLRNRGFFPNRINTV